MEASAIDARGAMELERFLTTFASSPNGGLIVTPSAFSAIFRERIIALAAGHKLPAIYFSRYFFIDGGLISYGPDTIDQFRRAAGYVDRILKGEKLQTCRFRHRPNLNSSSTSEPRGASTSPYLRGCSPMPTT